jgi:hypothetical protein
VLAYGSRPLLSNNVHTWTPRSVAPLWLGCSMSRGDRVRLWSWNALLGGHQALLWLLRDVGIPSPTKTCLSPSRSARELLLQGFQIFSGS